MAVGDRIFRTRYVGVGATPDMVDGATHARVTVAGPAVFIDPGDAGAPGPAEVQVGSGFGIGVQVFGINPIDLLALIGAVAANVVVGIKAEAGANEKITVKSVMFTGEIAPMEIPRNDQGGPIAPHGVQGIAEMGASDTIALMITKTTDT